MTWYLYSIIYNQNVGKQVILLEFLANTILHSKSTERRLVKFFKTLKYLLLKKKK